MLALFSSVSEQNSWVVSILIDMFVGRCPRGTVVSKSCWKEEVRHNYPGGRECGRFWEISQREGEFVVGAVYTFRSISNHLASVEGCEEGVGIDCALVD
jgi:hypothetical protein